MIEKIIITLTEPTVCCEKTLEDGTKIEVNGYSKIQVEVDSKTLRETIEKNMKEYMKHAQFLAYHAKLCDTYECYRQRRFWKLKFIVKLLEQEGIKPKTIETICPKQKEEICPTPDKTPNP